MEIWEIQGSGAVSPLVGQTARTLKNIVTALGYDSGLPNGFFIQTPDSGADASDQTSNGIFVVRKWQDFRAVSWAIFIAVTLS